ncbi:MAG TPA: YihA family ribosome biogenesis GTP-binding protein, partial [Flavisolibacter sp.]
LGEWQMPFAIVFTKADKSTQKEAAKNVHSFLEKLKETWEEAPPHFVTSAVKHLGARKMMQFIAQQNEVYREHKRGMV